MSHEILTPDEMAKADRLAIEGGPFDGYALMRNAGAAVAALVLARFASASTVHVLCGPGNNGGDGYVVAKALVETGCAVKLWAEGSPKPGSDAALAAADCQLKAQPLGDFEMKPGALVVDALYGAGLSKPLSAEAGRAAQLAADMKVPVVSVDLPSGLSGESGATLGEAFQATITVTFARKKPGHLLLPGRNLCGEVVVADIGIGDKVIDAVGARCFENVPALWLDKFPMPALDAYKYSRGHVGVFSGGPSATGAARLAAMAAARIGAGAVTVLSPSLSLSVNASHLTSIMLRKADTLEEVFGFLDARHPEALVYGPGLGPEPGVGNFLLDLLAAAENSPKGLVLDADGLTSLAAQPEALFAALHRMGAPRAILTPHEGEFRRLFPGIAEDEKLSKLEKARAASRLSNAVVVYKGPDTVIAAPDGRAAINSNGTPLLATAGSGDVLAGICAGLLAQGMPAFEAGCAAVWIHADAAQRFGPGLIAEDLPLALLSVLRNLREPGALPVPPGSLAAGKTLS
ncbi:NAD(P)H-hydrate dehydratase [Mesorhizobium sp. CGMCC 1.15528]|uniref:Bifunctional NAD(P)H-hydrate repair enzyme n=1 Tax=Mesorhizobium zhangyense TaxID=1776730 RepID=A0A7C9R492_9HYPH|nr:NAD(P)H-hydrate dehydratase [Mesorhizobium zhangyense]NGN39857.1 NAD(P)H-hydrate dehydratase [Mesorhizobium zhangyense]